MQKAAHLLMCLLMILSRAVFGSVEQVAGEYEIRPAIPVNSPVTEPPPVERPPLWVNPLPLPAMDFLRHDAAYFLSAMPFEECPLPVIYQAVLADDGAWLAEALAHGLSPDAGTPAGDTALCAAVRLGRLELVRELLLSGADARLPGYGGQVPIVLASLRRPAEIMRMLLVAGAYSDEPFAAPVEDFLLQDVVIRDLKASLQNDRGVTPLMACAARGDVEGAVVLMQHGARASKHTKKHARYPLNFAATQRFLFLMRVLLGRSPDAEPDLLITVDLSQQRAWISRQGKIIESTSISTGRAGYETPAGRYVITDKHRRWVSTIYKVPMPWFMRLNCGAIGLHSGYVTGRPASHGCIRLPESKARRFFELAKVGDEVQIVR
jgi:hypothetical protein